MIPGAISLTSFKWRRNLVIMSFASNKSPITFCSYGEVKYSIWPRMCGSFLGGMATGNKLTATSTESLNGTRKWFKHVDGSTMDWNIFVKKVWKLRLHVGIHRFYTLYLYSSFLRNTNRGNTCPHVNPSVRSTVLCTPIVQSDVTFTRSKLVLGGNRVLKGMMIPLCRVHVYYRNLQHTYCAKFFQSL